MAYLLEYIDWVQEMYTITADKKLRKETKLKYWKSGGTRVLKQEGKLLDIALHNVENMLQQPFCR